MNIGSAISRTALVASASALALLLSGCDRTKDTARATDPAPDATSTVGAKDCNAPGVSCTPEERGPGYSESMEGAGHGPGMSGREVGDGGTRMGGPPARR